MPSETNQKTTAQLWLERLKREAAQETAAAWFSYGMLTGMALLIAYIKGWHIALWEWLV